MTTISATTVQQAPGAATTVGSMVHGDPNSLFQQAGMETPGVDPNPNAGGGLQNMMAALGDAIPQLQQIFEALMNTFKQSGSFLDQGNNNTLTQKVMEMEGVSAKLGFVNPQNGEVTVAGPQNQGPQNQLEQQRPQPTAPQNQPGMGMGPG
ncbi:hypothetical protein [Micavibrio aeruginosavorus]|uniref:hypothetical protein n=1 Tax=Micavibrio aeruginosavorus TaxID=349221 RepID=UPI003F4A8976